VFNPSQEEGPAAPAGQVNMVLAWSADGRHWNWINPLESFIPLGATGEFDTCGVFSAKQDPLRTMVDDTLRFYCEYRPSRSDSPGVSLGLLLVISESDC
jgi:hypothetical protein